jgi:hypothetical protein
MKLEQVIKAKRPTTKLETTPQENTHTKKQNKNKKR